MKKLILAVALLGLFSSPSFAAYKDAPNVSKATGTLAVTHGGTNSSTGELSGLNITPTGSTKTSTFGSFAANTGLVSTSLFLNPTFARASSVNYFDVSGVMQTATAGNVAYDYDKTTHAYKGILFEPEATNLVRNSTAAGGSAGVNPTYWSLIGTSGDVTRTVESVNTVQGMSCARTRWSGTPSIATRTLTMETTTGIASTTGAQFNLSAYIRLQAGSFANVTSVFLSVNANDAVGSYLASYAGNNFLSSLGSSFFRGSSTLTTVHASTAYVQPYLNVMMTVGQPVDFTLDVCMPQLVSGSVVSSPISTTSGAAARAAASLSVIAPNDNTRFLATYADNTTAEFTATSAGLLTITATASKPNLRSVTAQ